jgi:hypothetical protein
MVVKLGVNLLEARIPSANQLSRVLQDFISFVIPILKPQRSRFHPKNTVNGIIKYRFNLLFKSSSESEELYLHLEYYYHLKLLNTFHS